jgi:hypothetical protein
MLLAGFAIWSDFPPTQRCCFGEAGCLRGFVETAFA